MAIDEDGLTKKVRDLNDAMRMHGIGGQIMLTVGIRELGDRVVDQIVAAVRDFDNFSEDNERVAQRNLTPARSQNRT